MKYSKSIVDRIFELMSTDDYSIGEICQNVGIDKATFHRWKNDKSDFCDSIKKADEIRLERFKVIARKSLLKKLTGYYYNEVKKIYGKDDKGKQTIKETTIIKKHIPPDTTAIIFTLKNVDSEYFKDRIETKIIEDPMGGVKSIHELVKNLQENGSFNDPLPYDQHHVEPLN
jgi:hypothetical protein